MYLLDLPVEIGALIFKNVDIKSRIKAYTVLELRKFYVPSLMRIFDVSRSSLASAKTLHLDVFQDFAANIQELNLSGIADLTAGQLAQHIQRCVNLKTLDITFTNIFLSDLNDICPENLKNISVNFFKWPRKVKGEDAWKKSIEVFQRQHFEYVHFIVSEIDSDLPLLFMNDGVPKTTSLKITAADTYNREIQEYYERHIPPPAEDNIIDVNFEKLTYVFRENFDKYEDLQWPRGVSNLDFEQIEYMFFLCENDISNILQRIEISVSPIFSSLFVNYIAHDLNITVTTDFNLDNISEDGYGYAVFKAWNKSFTQFNDTFFKTVLEELTDYFPTYVCMCMNDKIETKLTQAPSNWYCIDPCQGFERILDKLPEKVTLTDFCRGDDRLRRTNDLVYLTQSNTLKNITYLRLSDILLRVDFFSTLFNQCKKLHTLDILIEKPEDNFPAGALTLPNSMHLAKSLRNLKLTSQDIEYEEFFASLCQCPTLENIHIGEYQRGMQGDIDTQNMVLFIEKCPDLYSVFIETYILREERARLKSCLRAAADKFNRDYLFIEVCTHEVAWNPYADVFNPSPLNIIS